MVHTRRRAALQRPSLHTLPNDVLQYVVKQIGVKEIFPTALACTALRAAVAARLPDVDHNGHRTTTAVSFVFGHTIALAEWALALGCPHNDDTFEAFANRAALYGQVEVLLWLKNHNKYIDCMQVHYNAAMRGHVNVLESTINDFMPDLELYTMQMTLIAVMNGHLPVLDWLHANGRFSPWYVFPYVDSNDKYRVLEWLAEKGLSKVDTNARRRRQ